MWFVFAAFIIFTARRGTLVNYVSFMGGYNA